MKLLPEQEAAAPNQVSDSDSGVARHLAASRARRSPLRRAFWLGLLLAAALLFFCGWRLGRVEIDGGPEILGVFPGEFQACQGLLVAPPPDVATARLDVLLEIVAHARHYLRVYVLVRNEDDRQAWIDRLREDSVSEGANVSETDVQFLQAPFGDAWVRDYGPLVVNSFRGGAEMLDFEYATPFSDPNRLIDDRVPTLVAETLGVPARKVPVRLDGGNILSNGAGLCVMTPCRRDQNCETRWDEIRGVVRQYLGGQQLIVLAPLADEPTGHLDMFCTFTAPDTVVIGSCDPQTDRQNAELLDANAQLLQDVRTNCGPLKVERIPMPPHRDKEPWLTYTNVIYANGLLLMPSYPGVAKELEEQAAATYRRLLPNWRIVTINALPLAEKNGSLHCVSLNLGGIGWNKAAPVREATNPVRQATLPR